MFTDTLKQTPFAKRLTPQEQLWRLTDNDQHKILKQVLGHLKYNYQEDLCYALIAYIRFNIRRPFECPFMEEIFLTLIALVDGE